MQGIWPWVKGTFIAGTILFPVLTSEGAFPRLVLGDSGGIERNSPSYPGLSEVIPRAEELEKKASETRLTLSKKVQTQELRQQIQEAQAGLKELNKRLSSLGDPAKADYQRLVDLKAPLDSHRKALEGYLSTVSGKLQELETLKRRWEEELVFWTGWKTTLEVEKPEGLIEALARAETTIRDVTREISSDISGLVSLQEEVRKLLDENRALSRPLESALTRMRQEVFRRTEPAFFEGRFVDQLLVLPWDPVARGVVEVVEEAKDSLGKQGGILLIETLVVLGLALAGMWRKRSLVRGGKPPGLWGHPWALALTIVGVADSVFLGEFGGPWRYLGRNLFAFGVVIVWAGSTQQKGWRSLLYGMVSSLTFLDILKISGVPTAWCRVCLAGIALLGIPLTMAMPTESRFKRAGVRVAVAVLLVVFFAQVGGFANLSERVFQASGWSVLLILVGRITVLAINGVVDWILVHPRLTGSRLLQIIGSQTWAKVLRLLALCIWMIIALRLLTIWGFYGSSSEAFEGIFKPVISIGTANISLGLFLLGALAVYLGFLVSRVLNGILDAEVFPRTDLDVGARHAIGRIVHYALVLLGFLMAMSILGIHLESFLVLGGALGVGIGFGLQHVANNFVSGLILLFERPVKVGDTVQVEKEWGRVKRIGLRSTVIETFDRSELIVPNSQLVSNTVVNWTLSNPVARVRIPLGVAYGTNLELAMKLLIQAAKSNPKVLEDPPPNALFLGFGESSLNLELHAWVGDIKERLSVQSALCQEIITLCREAGVEIPYPQMDLHLRSIPRLCSHGCLERNCPQKGEKDP